PGIASRFGIPMHTPDTFSALVEAIRSLPESCAFGVHFHMASSQVGLSYWKHLCESMLRWCASIETLSGKQVSCLDMGGGWAPDDWQHDAAERFAQVVARAGALLPHVRQIISEPGK